ncbi:hypothetical protein FSP39_013864, partial [Pinctada imbricata]
DSNEDKESDIKYRLELNSLLENIFLITADEEIHPYEDSPSHCVFLRDFKESLDDQTWLDMGCIEQAVFERLLLPNPKQEVVNHSPSKNTQYSAQAGESQVLQYLYQCYCRLQAVRNNGLYQKFSQELDKCESVILMNARTCLQQPDLYPTQNLHTQMVTLLEDEGSFLLAGMEDMKDIFFDKLVSQILENEDDGPLSQVFSPVLAVMATKLQTELSLLNPAVIRVIDLLSFFTRKAPLAEVFLDYSTPKDWNNGKSFEQTLMGSMLSLSCIPRNEMGPYEFFENPSSRTKQDIDAVESNIQQPLGSINDRVYQFILAIIKLSADLRHRMLKWLGKCIHANWGRTKIWSSHMPQLVNQMYSSEGFCLNLCSVMLKLCLPFSVPLSDKLLKVKPSYCQVVTADESDIKKRSVHACGLQKETTLIPAEDNSRVTPEESYNFITECFFLTHQCLYMGFHTSHEKFLKLNQELHRVQRLYQEVRSQGTSEDVEPVRSIKRQMEQGMTLYLCMKAALTEPNLLEMCMNFHLATATWLSEVAISNDPTTFSALEYPMMDQVSPVLSCVPEFIMGNVTDFTVFLQRFKDNMFQMAGNKLEHLMTLILVYMGSPQRMKNPHLRAELAETLASLLPNQGESSKGMFSWFSKEQLFTEHKLIRHLTEKLLNVFVSIEMTGQSVAFEQKFNYRRPMYLVIEHIWEIELHRQEFKKLSQVAEDHIEDTDPPLFLRFINLLINDAIFLLDEAFDFMTQIKDKQREKENGDWNNLEPQQRQENESTLRQITMLARYHNLMGRFTINTLELITREIKSIFCHNSMVDRIAGMLNYFLLHLVGPKQRNFMVKDKKEIEFSPQETVSTIAQIYLNLGDTEAFCLAVCSDGRSYSAELFPKAIHVLQKIGKHTDMISQMMELKTKIEALGKKQEEEEELYSDAPDEFLDPIMGNLMKDPVILPSSRMTVDRSVIARHILSDQSDPFNRSPLSLDMVIPNEDLRTKIEEWKRQQKYKPS